MNSFASIEGLCNAVEAPAAKEESNIRCVILFDNEEVGFRLEYGCGKRADEAGRQRIAPRSGEQPSALIC